MELYAADLDIVDKLMADAPMTVIAQSRLYKTEKNINVATTPALRLA
tara:strand:- start:1402 stop:1542 length:141 start_codon:yes stop_codon:yes gene_type:complete